MTEFSQPSPGSSQSSPGRIVFGDDRSPGADVAWLWINDQRWEGWSLDVVEVTETELGPARPPGGEEWRDWSPEVPRVAFPQAGLGPIRHRTADADPRVVLCRCADADLLVVGPTGRGFLKRWLHLGSTTEWLLHEPPAPMVIARSAGPVRHAVVAVDGSEPAERALDALLRLPWASDLDVLAIGVYDGWSEPGVGLEAASKRLEAAGVRHRTEERRGKATETLLHVLEEHHPQLITVGARGRSTFQRVVAGSTASAIARSAACNVLITS